MYYFIIYYSTLVKNMMNEEEQLKELAKECGHGEFPNSSLEHRIFCETERDLVLFTFEEKDHALQFFEKAKGILPLYVRGLRYGPLSEPQIEK